MWTIFGRFAKLMSVTIDVHLLVIYGLVSKHLHLVFVWVFYKWYTGFIGTMIVSGTSVKSLFQEREHLGCKMTPSCFVLFGRVMSLTTYDILLHRILLNPFYTPFLSCSFRITPSPFSLPTGPVSPPSPSSGRPPRSSTLFPGHPHPRTFLPFPTSLVPPPSLGSTGGGGGSLDVAEDWLGVKTVLDIYHIRVFPSYLLWNK